MAAAGGAQWSSRFAFLMASVGFAVGLGNIWRFPYVTGENGGAAFVLVYLACAFGIGAPILIAEMLIGRRGQGSPPTAMTRVALESGKSSQWKVVGAMGLLAAYTIEIIDQTDIFIFNKKLPFAFRNCQSLQVMSAVVFFFIYGFDIILLIEK